MSSYPSGPFGGFARTRPIPYESQVDSLTMGQFFNAVYAWMAAGLALTGAVAYAVANQLLPIPMTSGIFLLLVVVELVLVFTISGAINRISATAATALFLLYSALNGVTLSGIFLLYAHATLTSTFLITAGTFAAMSIVGYTTKIDLTRFGSLLFAALIGIVLASVVNLFWHNAGLYWAISYLGVLLFVGLTAFDTQRLKYIAAQTGNTPALAHRMAIVGSLMLYLDFLNLFLFLLQIMGAGDRRR